MEIALADTIPNRNDYPTVNAAVLLHSLMAAQFFPHLIKWAVVVLVALVLFGTTPASHLVVIAALFIAARLSYIVAEAMRKEPTELEWHSLAAEVRGLWEALPPERKVSEAKALDLPPDASAFEFSEEWIAQAKRAQPALRSKYELLSESLGVVGFAGLLPLGIALLTADFFSFRAAQSWAGVSVFAACLTVYAVPHFLRRSFFKPASFRMAWWMVPFFPSLYAVLAGMMNVHPYLNPLHPEQERLAAERVLALENIVVAGNHADWVLRYARELDAQGAVRFVKKLRRSCIHEPRLRHKLHPIRSGIRHQREPPRCRLHGQIP